MLLDKVAEELCPRLAALGITKVPLASVVGSCWASCVPACLSPVFPLILPTFPPPHPRTFSTGNPHFWCAVSALWCGLPALDAPWSLTRRQVLTVPTSGIAAAMPFAVRLGVPLLFTRDSRPITMKDDAVLSATYPSRTKVGDVCVHSVWVGSTAPALPTLLSHTQPHTATLASRSLCRGLLL